MLFHPKERNDDTKVILCTNIYADQTDNHRILYINVRTQIFGTAVEITINVKNNISNEMIITEMSRWQGWVKYSTLLEYLYLITWYKVLKMSTWYLLVLDIPKMAKYLNLIVLGMSST